jgi:hypothetical protein
MYRSVTRTEVLWTCNCEQSQVTLCLLAKYTSCCHLAVAIWGWQQILTNNFLPRICVMDLCILRRIVLQRDTRCLPCDMKQWPQVLENTLRSVCLGFCLRLSNVLHGCGSVKHPLWHKFILWQCYQVAVPRSPDVWITDTNSASSTHIQGDSGGNVNIFDGHTVGYCEKRSSYEHVSNYEWLPR